MAEYKIVNSGTGKCLNIYGENVLSLKYNQNVTLWDDTGSREQRWLINAVGTSTVIKSVIDAEFALNVHRLGNPFNCDVYPLKGNETDAEVCFVKSGENYVIKLKNYDLCLTAASSENGANVYWAKLKEGLYQTWSLIELSAEDNKEGNTAISINMPVNLNQRYSRNDAVIREYGCCVCCSCDVASYYAKRDYTLEELRSKGVYSLDDASCVWSKVPSAAFSFFYGKSQGELYSKLRAEISAGRPVLVYMKGKYQHWVAAYGFTGTGSSSAEIRVLDPYGESTDVKNGRDTTLAHSFSIQGASEIRLLVLTSGKPY